MSSSPEMRFWQRLMVRRPPREEPGALARSCARLGLLGLAALAAAVLALTVLAISALAPPPPPPARTVALQRAGLPATGGARRLVDGRTLWLTPDRDGHWLALDLACPQAGCLVAGPLREGGFVCPCCGSRFGPDGKLLSGPAPSGLGRLPVRPRGGELVLEVGP